MLLFHRVCGGCDDADVGADGGNHRCMQVRVADSNGN